MKFLRLGPARPRVSASLLALLVAALAPAAGDAREGARRGESGVSIEELPRPTRRGYEDLILIMEPLRPATGPGAVKRVLPEEAGPAAGAAKETAARRPEPKALETLEGAAAAKPAPAPAAEAPVAPDPASEPAAAKLAPASAETAAAEAPPVALTEGEPPELSGALALAVAHRPAAPPVAASGLASLELLREPDPVASGLMSLLPAAQAAPAPVILAQGPVALGPEIPARESPPAPEAAASAGTSPAPAAAPAPGPAALAQGAVSPADEPAAQAPAQPPKGAVSPRTPSSKAGQSAPAAEIAAPPPQDKEAGVPKEPRAEQKSEAVPGAGAEADGAYAAALAVSVKGPAEVRLADLATLSLPAGRVFVPREAAAQIYANAPGAFDASKLGLVLPLSRDAGWVAFVELVPEGFVRDHGGRGVEPNEVLAGLRKLAAQENAARQEAGEAPVVLTEWVDPPAYDVKKHRLSSCIGVSTQGVRGGGDPLVDCTTFTLGREGALKVQIVAAAADLERFRGEAAAIAGGINYDQGKAYEDGDPTKDRVAPYDLSGLMTGGLSRQETTPAPAKAKAPEAASATPAVAAPSPIAPGLLESWGLSLAALAALVGGVLWLGRKAKEPAIAAPATMPEARKQEAEAAVAAQAGVIPSLFARVTALAAERLAKLRRTGAARSAFAGFAGKPKAQAPAVAAPQSDPMAAAGGASAVAAKISPLVGLTAFVRSKLPKRSEEAATAKAREEAVAQSEAAAAALSRFSGMMRGHDDTAAGADKQDHGGQIASVAAAAAAVDLVEPGDQAAASAALSAREALRRANA